MQWEGYREGHDDLRYLATLENLVEAAKRRGGQSAELARKTQLWIIRLDPARADLDDMRGQIIDHILALRKAIAE